MNAELMAPPKTTQELNKQSVDDWVYDQDHFFDSLRDNKVLSWESIIDVLMNYLRGKKNVKVAVRFTLLPTGNYYIEFWDVCNTGTTYKMLGSQVMRKVHKRDRIKEEAGKLGVHNMGIRQLLSNHLTEDNLVSDGVTFITQQNGEANDKIFVSKKFNPYDIDKKVIEKHGKYVDDFSELGIDFPPEVHPTQNFLYFGYGEVMPEDIIGVDSDREFLEVIADMVSTFFMSAIDENNISFHLIEQNDEGDVFNKIDITEGACLYDEYGNIKKYSELKQKPFVLSTPHQYPSRYLQSCKLTEDIKNTFKISKKRIFGYVPELGLKLDDGWKLITVDNSPTIGVVIGRHYNQAADGISYTWTFIETSVNNVNTTTEKGKVTFPSTESGNDIKCVNGKYWKELKQKVSPVSHIKSIFPNLNVLETKRRDIVWNLTQGKVPYDDNNQQQIITPVVKAILEVYGLDIENLSSVKLVDREIKFYGGKVILDLGLIVIDKDGNEYHIANEWKTHEGKINFHQCVSEIHGWELMFGQKPNEFIISCHSKGEKEPTDSESNFKGTTRDTLNKLSTAYPDIKFKLMDTRYFDLAKEYSTYKKLF